MDRTRRGSKELGRRVQELRDREGMSLRALAGAAGLAPMTISYVERGQRRVRLVTLRRIADAIDPESFPELRRLAEEDDAIVPDNPWSGKRERRRTARAETFVERLRWSPVWKKLGVTVRSSR